MKSKTVLAVALALILAGCGEDPQPPAKPPKPPEPGGAAVKEPLRSGPAARPETAAADLAAAAAGNNRFALDLYARLATEKKGENLFCSPFSISGALAMTSAGARGDTAAQMRKALHFTLKDEQLHPALGALIHDLNAAGEKGKFQLSVANALWAEKTHKFLPAFLDVNRRCYGAGLKTLDFKKDTEGARKTINAWVEKQTRDKIKELLRPGVLDEGTRLVLTNAVYFKGDWLSKFEKKETKDAPFHLTAGKSVKLPTMFQDGGFRYMKGDDFQLLELPYAGCWLSMVILLPKKIDGLAALEKSLTAEKLAEWTGSSFPHAQWTVLHHRRVKVHLPRFKMISQFRLEKTLAALGMTDAFTMKADFSGMDGIPAESDDSLYISAVVHKAFVEVNEEGSEAAAATAVVMDPKNGHSTPPPPNVFRADHPFLFLIRDRKSGSILFIGRVMNPEP